MSPQLKLRAAATPLVMAGALWATSALAPIALGGGAQTPPPCGPDGVCVPRPQTFGWYQTRWRTFPGDAAQIPPTDAKDDEKPEEEELGGPKEPTPAQEGLLGPTRAPRDGGAPGEAPAAEGEEDPAASGLGTLPGEVPLPGMELPGIGQPAAPAGEQPAPAPDAAPGAVPEPGAGGEPAGDPLDPFGAAPVPPAWLKHASLRNRDPVNAPAADSLPRVEQAAVAESTSVVAPAAARTIPLDGPNLHSDDAPPQLPRTLHVGLTGAAPARRVAPPQAAAPAIVQPASVAPIVDDRVTAASAEQPAGIHLINPAAAMVEPAAEGLQQAIYFEATDR